jgi:ubiquinone/menaquinone biosynthesis C-methylase UbiE
MGMNSIDRLIRDPTFKRLMKNVLPTKEQGDFALAARVKELLPLDDFTVSQYYFGLDYYKQRIQSVFPSSGTFLDMGCGSGNWSVAASSLHPHVIGIDVHQERLNVAAQIASEYASPGNKIEFIRLTTHQIPLPDASVDYFLCYNAFQTMDISHRYFLREAQRVTRKGGRMYLWITDVGFLLYLLVHAIESRNASSFFGWSRLMIKNLAFLLHLRRQPASFMRKSYVLRIFKETGWKLLWVGPEGHYKDLALNPIFPLLYAGLPFGREYLFERA